MANEKTVLLCDSDEALLQQVSAELLQDGFDVTTISDAGELTKGLRQGRHAVVVVNPDMNGFDAESLCQFKQETHVPVVLLLEPNSTSRNIFGSCTADDVVEKPVQAGNFQMLLNKLYTWNKAVKE